jgi:Spy/CpxP family protein refolding chaperone
MAQGPVRNLNLNVPMKIPRFIFALGVLASLPALHAQDQSTTPPPQPPEHAARPHRAIDPDRMVARLDHQVGPLTAEQKTQIKQLITTNLEKAKAAQENRREAMKAQREQIRALLTPDQQKKFDELPRHRPGDDEPKHTE